MFDLKLENSNHNIVDLNDEQNYVVLSASGLTPPSASLFMSKSPNKKGAKHNGSTLNERNIVIEIKILGDIEKNRNALYSWVDTEQYVKVYFRNGTKNVYCEGYVSDCSIDLFTDRETVGLAITCGNPYWHDLQTISADISMLLKHFTFPFAVDESGVPLSTIHGEETINVFNAGAETGVRITVKCNSELKNFVIYDARDTTRRFMINYTCPAGSLIIIDTEASPKNVKLTLTNGEIVNLLKYLNNNPTWFSLKKGNNVFGRTADSGIDDAEILINFTNKYLGV